MDGRVPSVADVTKDVTVATARILIEFPVVNKELFITGEKPRQRYGAVSSWDAMRYATGLNLAGESRLPVKRAKSVAFLSQILATEIRQYFSSFRMQTFLIYSFLIFVTYFILII